MTPESSLVVTRGLRKSFGSQVVLNGVDLEVRKGESIAVLGRSGTGKSVLLKVLIGLHKPDGGQILVFGKDLATLNEHELNEVRKRIGFLFQQSALYDSLDVCENVAFPLRRHTKMNGAERVKKVRELLAAVGMEETISKMPAELSGGMQRRVGLARALALDPEILLFDEPTSGLDPITAAEIVKLIAEQKQKRGVTGIVVTHDIHSAKSFVDRLVVLNEGRIVMQGTYAELEKSRDAFVEQYLREAA
jgi:phospholipid/cholesterol/gamma-HCH transport system ATP-binding protein